MAANKLIVYLYVSFRNFRSYITNNFFLRFPSRSFRKLILKSVLAEFGENCSFLMGIEIRNGKKITLGKNVVMNKNVLLDGRGGRIIIGNNVDIAQETNIWTLEHDVHNDYHRAKGGDVIIHDYVWIASRVTILPGVVIGRGAVIACNSVVTKNVEPMAIMGGIPAKKIGIRRSALLYNLDYDPIFK